MNHINLVEDYTLEITNIEEEKDSDETSNLEAPNEAKKTRAHELTGPHLPPEMLDRVFQLLSPQDLKSVVQVCWLWRQVGERPGRWTWGVARSTGESMAEVLGSRRMLLVRGLRLQG